MEPPQRWFRQHYAVHPWICTSRSRPYVAPDQLKVIGYPSCIMILLGALLVALVPAEARQGQIPRIGYVSANYASAPGALVDSFRHGLRDLGYVEKNVVIEYRYAEGRDDRLPTLARELVHLNIDVLVTSTVLAARAAKQATASIPIIFVIKEDPVVRRPRGQPRTSRR